MDFLALLLFVCLVFLAGAAVGIVYTSQIHAKIASLEASVAALVAAVKAKL